MHQCRDATSFIRNIKSKPQLTYINRHMIVRYTNTNLKHENLATIKVFKPCQIKTKNAKS
jgi:hypothetical protein